MNEQLIERLNDRLEDCNAVIQKFKENLDKDPLYALSWSKDTFKAAAMLDLLQWVIPVFEKHEAQVVADELTRRLIQRATCPAQSTSPTSNLVDDYKTAVIAEVLDMMRWWVEK